MPHVAVFIRGILDTHFVRLILFVRYGIGTIPITSIALFFVVVVVVLLSPRFDIFNEINKTTSDTHKFYIYSIYYTITYIDTLYACLL